MTIDDNRVNPAALDALLRDERVRLHGETWPAATAGSLALAVTLVAVMWSVLAAETLLGWLAGLCLVLLARVALGRAQARAASDPAIAETWIRRYRAISAAHGLAWAMASILMFPGLEQSHQTFLVFAVTGICVSSLSAYAFDIRAALWFCLPALGALAACLLELQDDVGRVTGISVLLFVVYVAVVALRSARVVRHNVALRGADAQRLDELRRSHHQLRQAERLAQLGSFDWDPVSGALTWTDEHYRLWGLEPQAQPATYALFINGVHPQDRPQLELMLARAMRGELDYDFLYRVCHPDGSQRHIHGRSEVFFDDDKRAIRVVGTVQDVTERSLAQTALADKQHVLTAMQQTTQLGFWFVDHKGITTDVNPAMCEMLGRTAPAVLGQEVFSFFDDENGNTLRRRLASPRGPRPGSLDLTLTRPDGSMVHCLVNVTPITNVHGESVGLVGMFSDLTLIDSTRQALTTAEFVVNSVSDMVSLLDRRGNYLLVNDAWCRALGLRREQVIGRPSGEVVPALGTPERRTAFQECLASGEVRVLRAMVHLPGVGDRFIETNLSPFRSEQAGVGGVVATSRDITEQEATRQALAQSLENLRRTFNATTDGMFAYNENDPSGRLLFVNDRFLELWEIPVEQADHISRADIMDASRRLFADPVGEEQRLRAVLAMDVPHEDRVVMKDGRILLRHSVPLKDQSGLTRVWSFRDITLQEHAFEALRSSESQQRALMDAFPGYVGVIDARFTYRYVNQRLADLVGMGPADIVGRSLRDVMGEARFAEIAADVETARRVGRAISTRTYEATARRPRVDLQVTHVASADQAGSEPVYYAFGVDVTDRVQAEDALVLARDEAERANRAKSAFLASVSHELKTPLNAILGFSQLLRTDPQMASTSSDNAGEIERAGQHLLSLVDDLIDLGQVESGSLELEMARIPLESVINESLSLVAPLAAKQGIRIVYSGGDARNAMVMADATRLRQVVINLLSNAIKYNRPEGTVHVSCARRAASAGRHHKPSVRIGVRDTGMGISADRAASMFSAFDRLGAERGSVEGTGIGLVITKRLVNAMGGDMGYESEVGQGSLFWIELAQAGGGPLVRPSAARPGADATTGALAAHRPRLLVAEDYAPNQAVLRLQLTGLGCDVDVVNDGTAALTRWSTGHYDLILTDLDMPVMDGMELARTIRLREKVRGGRIPIIALSAAVIGAERARCLEAGMDDVLGKPIAAHGLGLMLSRWIAGQPAAPVASANPATRKRGSGPDAAVLEIDRLYEVLGRVSGTQAQALLSTFLDAARSGLREMGRADLQAPLLLREMHRQRSSASTVGATQYAALAAALEHDARMGIPRKLEARLAQMSDALRDVASAIERLRDELDDSAPVPLTEPAPALVHRSVLVVDDDPVVLMQMTQMLRGLGLREVLTARNGVEAMQLVGRRRKAIDVVVCDLNMPEMDGVEMIRRFGQSNFGGALILMSGADEQILSTVGKLASLQGLTVLGQIHKPVTPQAMAEMLHQTSDEPVRRPAARPGSALTPEAIRDGIALGEFMVWLQPKVDAVTLLPIGVEALARWRQPDGSFVPPDVFIVMAERSGLIAELSAVLVAHALTDGARLHAAGFPLKIAVNLSALWLDDLSLPDLMLQSADAVGLTPADIILEVTETGVTKDVATALDVLSRLRLKGFGLSIDDFGIGYSSFEQVGRIPFTEMKLDRSFVNRGVRDAAARAILESSMAMAQKLNLRTVAEGVETQTELELMRDLGCDSVQGYLIAHPMPVTELLVWLQQRTSAG